MPEFETSIIIPVYNQWEFTKRCLKSIAETVKNKAVEVIIVDNGSSDLTPKACPFLGSQLFGQSFQYRRCPQNINFGPACNLGAQMAKGEFALFLNNDTEVLPGWYQPLVDDFAAYPDIAATGPLLLYPQRTPLGYTIQHLGIYVTLDRKVGHLYEGIPAESALAERRRFFQIITAACMLMRKSVFINASMFDEHYINGFEDVDLCSRLYNSGLRMTVNPQAKVVHYTSQTPGSFVHDSENSRYFVEHRLHLLKPDYPALVENDGLVVDAGAWLTQPVTLPQKLIEQLAPVADDSPSEIMKALTDYPYWQTGWQSLINKTSDYTEKAILQEMYYKLLPDPVLALNACKEAAMRNVEPIEWFKKAASFCKQFQQYKNTALQMRQLSSEYGFQELVQEYEQWLRQTGEFQKKHFMPFMASFWKLIKKSTIPLPPPSQWAYTAWLYNRPQKKSAAKGSKRHFSVPLVLEKPEKAARLLDSLMAQTYPFWEVCIVTAESQILQRYAKDKRIKIQTVEQNLDFRSRLQIALAMTSHDYIAFIDDDYTLSPNAFATVNDFINKGAKLIYCDEDEMNADGCFVNPYFKNKMDMELLPEQDYISSFCICVKAILKELVGCDYHTLYGLLLHYVEHCQRQQMQHISQILCHCHVKNTSPLNKDVQIWLDQYYPGAKVKEIAPYRRISWPLPNPAPSVSIICDLTHLPFSVKKYFSDWQSLTNYKYEMIVLLDNKNEKLNRDIEQWQLSEQEWIKVYQIPPNLNPGQRFNWGASQSRSDITAFFATAALPKTPGWLENLISTLWRSNIGCCAGKLTYQSGSTVHAGYTVDAYRNLRPLFTNMPNQPRWFYWLAREVDAVDSLCLFTKTEIFKNNGGFNDAMSAYSQDYCLRLQKKGLISIWQPEAEFMIPDNIQLEDLTKLNQYWRGRLEPCNQNLLIDDGAWSLRKDY